jgi:hypothetical protein
MRIHIILSISTLTLFALVLTACKKNNGVAVNDIPGGQQIGANLFYCSKIDAKSIWTSDTIITHATNLTLLGTTNDNDCGTTSSTMVAQYELDATKTANENLVKNELATDVSLYLKVQDIYGTGFTFGDSMMVKVYNTPTNIVKPIYNSSNFANYITGATELYSGYIVFGLDKKVNYQGADTLQSLVRIKLKRSFLNTFLASNNSANIINTMYDVASFFKNIVIVPVANPKHFVAKLNMLNNFSSIVIRTDSGTVFKRYTTIKPISSSIYGHNIVNERKANSPLVLSVTNPNNANAYMQGGVSRAVLTFNDLSTLSDSGNLIINTAQLTIMPTNNSNAEYAPVALYNLGYLIPDGHVVILSDYELELISYYDGSYKSATNTITFNIAHHVQDVINKKIKNYPLVLVPSLQGTYTNITKIQSSNVKLNITYTKVK